ncbi:MAG TPA: hypothetical protein VKF14_21000 [Candidatus Dormibacteraeota bacterium]|nr:hypothetical protein [Candidatus Dormibacteraeota bacterium]
MGVKDTLPRENNVQATSGSAVDLLAVDPRYELAYEAGVRLLVQQQSTIDNLRSRATTLLSAATVAVSLMAGLGVVGKDVALPVWVVVTALSVLVLIGIATILIVWPHTWKLGLSPSKLLDDYIEASPARSLTDLQRNCAVYGERHFDFNERRLKWLSRVFRLECVLLIVEVMTMFVVLATRS